MMTQGRRVLLSIRWIVAGASAVLATVAVLGVTAVTERRTRDVFVREIETRILLQARNLAGASSGALLSEYPDFTLAPLLGEMQSHQPELALLVVVDRSGAIQGHSDVRRLGSRYVPPRNLAAVASSVPRRAGESLSANAVVLVATTPIVDARGNLLGSAVIGLRRSHIEHELAEIGRQQLLILGALLGAAGLCSFVLMSILLRPIAVLRAGIERIGRGELDAKVELTDRTEFGLLASAVNDMASALKAAQVEMVERERLAHEMELAHQIQRSLLPSRPVVSGEFVITGQQWAAAEVGGDCYDVQELPDGSVALTIADVSGKGLGGCLIASMLLSLIRALRPLHASPTSLLIALDERLGEILPRGGFVTMFYGLLDPRTGRMTYASAGHNPTLIYRARERSAEWLWTSGVPLGAFRGGKIRETLEDSILDLGPGDLLLQTTDGINEAAEPAEERPFGFEGVEKLILETAPLGARAIVDRLHRAVEEWRGGGLPADDETVLVVSREGAGEHDQPHRSLSQFASLETEEVLRCLAVARSRGDSLRLPTSLESLPHIDAWLRKTALLDGVDPEAGFLLNLTLYEVCANIVEHGHSKDAKECFEIWWIPGDERSKGCFIVCDHGLPFRGDSRKPADLNDRQVRKRGRGLGLEIIHRSMHRITYHPGTTSGNLTVLDWKPAPERIEGEELRHA